MEISAACHPPPGGSNALKPVKWGEIPAAQLNPAKAGREVEIGDGTRHPTSSLDKGGHWSKWGAFEVESGSKTG